MFQIEKKIYESQNFVVYFPRHLKIMVSWTLFVSFFLINLKHNFSYATRRALSNHLEKEKKHSSQILNCGFLTYTVNTFQI